MKKVSCLLGTYCLYSFAIIGLSYCLRSIEKYRTERWL